jgi:hypothetical protein
MGRVRTLRVRIVFGELDGRGQGLLGLIREVQVGCHGGYVGCDCASPSGGMSAYIRPEQNCEKEQASAGDVERFREISRMLGADCLFWTIAPNQIQRTDLRPQLNIGGPLDPE